MFFVSFCKPHASVTPQTLSRWILFVMEAAGIDVSAWKAHSSRAAASAFHRRKKTPVEILKLADWSSTSPVYKKFYELYI